MRTDVKDDGTLTIYSRLDHHNKTLNTAGANFTIHAFERDSTRSVRSFHLPGDADMDGATAKLNNSTLIVRVPKHHTGAAAGTRRVPVE